MTKINKVDEATKVAIKRKSAYSLPNRPSEQGMKAEDIKKAFWQPVIDVTNSTLSELDRVVDETNREIERVASETNIAISSSALFDKIIRTQEEFEALIASPTWLDAVSVALIGDGGTLKFTLSFDGNTGIKIPSTVKQIQGFNACTIHASSKTNTIKSVLYYENMPTDFGYSIKDLKILNGAYIQCGFDNCTNLTNCVSEGDESGGFIDCNNLTNCKVRPGKTIGTGTFRRCKNVINCESTLTRYYECSNLINCKASCFSECIDLINCYAYNVNAIGSGSFTSCTRLTNCNGYTMGVLNHDVHTFNNCEQLTNCTATSAHYETVGITYNFRHCSQLTNCLSIGTGNKDSVSFYSCSYLNGCKSDNTVTFPDYGGSTYKRDDASCDI